MAKTTTTIQRESKRVKRKGVHAKSKQSTSKNADNYKKTYKGQGR